MSEELWSFSHLIVTLATPKLLTFDNKNKKDFILYCARLIVTLATPKLLTFGKTQINLVFLSLNRIVGCAEVTHARQ